MIAETNPVASALELSASYRSLSEKLATVDSSRFRRVIDVPADLVQSVVEYKQVVASLDELGFSDVRDLVPGLKLDDSGKLVSSLPVPRVVNVNEGFITLDNIACVGADGNIFEQYEALSVRKDLDKNGDLTYVKLPFYNAIYYLENTKLFLPSFALSCNILAALYANRSDCEAANTLHKAMAQNWQAQNTIVNWKTGQVINYPIKMDLMDLSESPDVNLERTRKVLPFYGSELNDTALECALKDHDYDSFIRNLTGLENPGVLVEIGNEYGKTTMLRISKDNEPRNARLGCNAEAFNLSADGMLRDGMTVRGMGFPRKKDAADANADKTYANADEPKWKA